MTVRWGIAGPGRIASLMVEEIRGAEGSDLVAVGSRSADRAAGFAARHSIPQAYAGYAELFGSEVDVIYLATPHAQHAELALAAIEAGKAVLVEKAFTTSVPQTKAVIEAAVAHGVFVMEAMWTRFLPAITELRRLVSEGEIGQVQTISGDLLAFREYDPADRLFDPALGGGAILDLGVYVLSFVQQFLGMPQSVQAVGSSYPNGAEGSAGILLGWPNGRLATQVVGFTTPGPGRQILAGTKGWIEVEPRFHRGESLVVHRLGEEPRRVRLPKSGLGYRHQIEHVNQCLAAGLTQSPVMSLADTLDVQELMARVLAGLGR